MQKLSIDLSLCNNISIEKEIIQLYNDNNLDAKSLLIMGYMALKAAAHMHISTKESSELHFVKNAYDTLLQDIKNCYSDKWKDQSKEFDMYKQLLENTTNAYKTDYVTQLQNIQSSYNLAVESMRKETINSSQLAICQLAVENERELAKKDNEIASLREKLAWNDALSLSKSAVLIAEKEQHIAVLTDKLTGLVQREQERKEVDMLKTSKSHQEEVESLKEQIAVLKGSTFSKGIVGENIIKGMLVKHFPKHEVIDKSGTTAESDIHLSRPSDGAFIAFECKNKATVTLQDVQKSMRDITELKDKYGERFSGYVFVSLRSLNIPSKGTAFELIDGHVPVAWIGCDETVPAYIDCLPAITEVLWSVSESMQSIQSLQDFSKHMDNFRKGVSELMHDVSTQFEANIKGLSYIQSSARSIIDNQHNILKGIKRFIELNAHYLPTNATSSGFCCYVCKKEFKRKGDLTRHQKSCILNNPQ